MVSQHLCDVNCELRKMKIKHIALLGVLIPVSLFAQENKSKVLDTTATKAIELNTVIVTGQGKTDPVLTTVKI
ncbi:MAG TPA: hypothetical protein DC015_09215, partial [Aequorivita sp.]|nr:hypothetical protein [Aequorivita sp.]